MNEGFWLKIAVAVVLLAFVGCFTGVGVAAIEAQSANVRVEACKSLPISKRQACISPTPVNSRVTAVNACNTAVANWRATFEDSKSFPYWQQCMTDMRHG